MKRFLIVAAAAMMLWAAPPATTVREMMETVRAAIARRESDGDLEKALRKVHLSERLDLRVIEELESEGAGPKAVEELMQLRDRSRALKPPVGKPLFDDPLGPSTEELRNLVAAARSAALNYAKSLPDFICTQIVRRSDSVTGHWRPRDTLELRLSYFGLKEDYKLLKVNGRDSVRSYNSMGGARSEGEFGSLLRQIFEPRGTFGWSNWTHLRKRPAYVLSFHIKAEDSSFHLEFERGRGMGRYSVIPGQRGFVWIDKETNQILRVLAEAADIPRGFPIQSSSTLLDYEFMAVGTRDFLLPLRADIRLGSRDLLTRNEVEFKGYRKFSGEATISFDEK